jgi:hypothetical protein
MQELKYRPMDILVSRKKQSSLCVKKRKEAIIMVVGKDLFFYQVIEFRELVLIGDFMEEKLPKGV